MSKFVSWFTDFIDSCDGISVYFIDKANEIYDSDIDHKVLKKFKASFCDDLRKKYTESPDFEINKLSTFEERKNTLYFYDFSPKEMPFEFKLTTKVVQHPANSPIKKYKVANGKISNIKGAIVLLEKGSTSECVAFYQHVFPVSLLGPDKGILNITTHKTRLVELTQDVLKLNTKFVFMQCQSGYFVEQTNVLETNLHFKNAIKTRAEKYVGEIQKMNLVTDTKVILERIDKEPSYGKKIISAYKNSVVLSSGIKNSEMIKFAQSQEYYKDHLKPSACGNSFIVSNITQSKRFVELLNDNFLKSELTDKNYLASSKKLFK